MNTFWTTAASMAVALAVFATPAAAQSGTGSGEAAPQSGSGMMGQGWGPCPGMMGPGMMGQGWGPGPGMMGPGMMGQGWGPGPGMMGPGMMGQGWGPGPGMMGPGMMGQGWGPGPGMMGPGMMGQGWGGGPVQRPVEVTADNVRRMMQRHLAMMGNDRLKVGEIQDAGDHVTAEIVTQEGSLVDKLRIDKQTGTLQRVQ